MTLVLLWVYCVFHRFLYLTDQTVSHVRSDPTYDLLWGDKSGRKSPLLAGALVQLFSPLLWSHHRFPPDTRALKLSAYGVNGGPCFYSHPSLFIIYLPPLYTWHHHHQISLDQQNHIRRRMCVCESDIKRVRSRHPPTPTHARTHAGCCDVGRNLLCVMFPLSLDA